MNKTCRICGEVKLKDDFYKDKKSKDGLCGECKKCRRDYHRKWQRTEGGKIATRGYAHKYNKSKKGREKRKVYLNGQSKPSKIKIEAIRKINNYISQGRMERGPCVVCGSTENVQGHHEDYYRPLDVIWMCASHHINLHIAKRKLETGMPLF